MAEPMILAYGRGELPEFPGAPDSDRRHRAGRPCRRRDRRRVARPVRRPASPTYFHVCVGRAQPADVPAAVRAGARVLRPPPVRPAASAARCACRTWRFPGAQRVERAAAARRRAHRSADRALGLAPRSEPHARLAPASSTGTKRRLDFLRRYLDLYRAYAAGRAAVRRRPARSRSPGARPATTAATSPSTRPSSTGPLPRATCTARASPSRCASRRHPQTPPAPAVTRGHASSRATGAGVLAVFDMDGTLLSSNVIETYLWLRLPELRRAGAAREVAEHAARACRRASAPSARDRGAPSCARSTAGTTAPTCDELDRLVDEVRHRATCWSRLSAAAVRRVREHRAAGPPHGAASPARSGR